MATTTTTAQLVPHHGIHRKMLRQCKPPPPPQKKNAIETKNPKVNTNEIELREAVASRLYIPLETTSLY